jgi:hypothetical protein
MQDETPWEDAILQPTTLATLGPLHPWYAGWETWNARDRSAKPKQASSTQSDESRKGVKHEPTTRPRRSSGARASPVRLPG